MVTKNIGPNFVMSSQWFFFPFINGLYDTSKVLQSCQKKWNFLFGSGNITYQLLGHPKSGATFLVFEVTIQLFGQPKIGANLWKTNSKYIYINELHNAFANNVQQHGNCCFEYKQQISTNLLRHHKLGSKFWLLVLKFSFIDLASVQKVWKWCPIKKLFFIFYV